MGGRGSNSSITSNPSKTKLYVKQTQNNAFFKNKYIDLDGKQAITDGFSIYKLNNAGIKEKGGEQLKGTIEGTLKSLQYDMKNQKLEYKSIDSLIKSENTTTSDYGMKLVNSPSENYGFDIKRVKMAKTILGKDTEYAYVKTGAYHSMVFRNKKGETGFLLPARRGRSY